MFYKKASEAKEFEAGDKTLLKEIAHPRGDQISIGYSLAEARLTQGQASLPHRLNASELYYILQGEGCLHINEQSIKLEKGDSCLVSAKAEQFIENVGEGDLIFLCIVEPYWREEDEFLD